MKITRYHLWQIFIWGSLICWVGLAPQASVYGQEQPSPPPASRPKSPGLIRFSGDEAVFTVEEGRNIATYTGNVKVVQDDMSLFSDTLFVYFEQGRNALEKVVAKGNVRLVRDDVTVTGERGIYYSKEQILEFEGNAKLWQGNNTIIAHRIIALLPQEVIEGYGTEAKRVIMTVYQKNRSPSQEALWTDSETDSPQESSPIVIIADTLTLDHRVQKARFSGDVIVSQRSTEIRSDEMTVFLAKMGGSEDGVDRIDVSGNVRITRESMIISGEKGRYLEQEHLAIVEGGANKKARIEDATNNMILEAPYIEANLVTNTVKARQHVMDTVTATEGDNLVADQREEHDAQTLPSVTMYPGKN